MKRKKKEDVWDDSDDDELEDYGAPGSELADAARLELAKLNAKDAKFTVQALRYINDYLNSIPRRSRRGACPRARSAVRR